MDVLAQLFATGRIADIVIALMIAEAVALLAYNRATGCGVAPFELVTNLAAGISLFLALRFALTGAAWPWIGASLGLALAAHLADLKSRWRG